MTCDLNSLQQIQCFYVLVVPIKLTRHLATLRAVLSAMAYTLSIWRCNLAPRTDIDFLTWTVATGQTGRRHIVYWSAGEFLYQLVARFSITCLGALTELTAFEPGSNVSRHSVPEKSFTEQRICVRPKRWL